LVYWIVGKSSWFSTEVGGVEADDADDLDAINAMMEGARPQQRGSKIADGKRDGRDLRSMEGLSAPFPTMGRCEVGGLYSQLNFCWRLWDTLWY
jgi:hypothetical protein